MNKKIITILIILLFSFSIAYATDNTTEDVESEDKTSYIMPISISSDSIEFSDGFIGFSLDGDDLTTSDGFSPEQTDDSELQNYIKLAIIECYKQSREDDIGEIVASFCDGSYTDSDDELITAVLDSDDEIEDSTVVELYDGSIATFDFELLKSSDDKSDCIAYKVSIDDSTSDDSVLGASDSEVENASDSDDAQSESDNNNVDESEPTTSDDASEPATSDDSNNNTPETTGEDNNTQINETNKTIINKTNTVIVNEKNTTVITKNNVNNDTPQDAILKTAGNPLFILVVVVAIIAIVVFEKHRRG